MLQSIKKYEEMYYTLWWCKNAPNKSYQPFNVSIVVLYLDIKCPFMEVVFKNKSLYGSDSPKLQTLKG